MQLGETFGQRESKAGPLLLPSWAGNKLLELAEKTAEVRFSDPNACISDRNLNPRSVCLRSDRDTTARWRELDRVGQEVQEHLPHLGRVGHEREFFRLALKTDFLGPRQGVNGGENSLENLSYMYSLP